MAPWGFQLLTSGHRDVFVMFRTATTSFMITKNIFSSSDTYTIASLRLNWLNKLNSRLTWSEADHSVAARVLQSAYLRGAARAIILRPVLLASYLKVKGKSEWGTLVPMINVDNARGRRLKLCKIRKIITCVTWISRQRLGKHISEVIQL
jgi:hypothetical protein